MKRIYYIFYILLLASLYGCEDRLTYPGEIPDGVSDARFQLSFNHFTPSLENSRSSGTAIKSIDKLWVVIYTTDGTLYEYKQIGDYKLTPNSRPDGSESSEVETGHAEFTMRLPNGRYRIYAVANCDLTAEDVISETALQNKKLTWQNEKLNGTKGQPNSEMFGYFTNSEKGDMNSTKGFQAGEVIVNGSLPLHAWIKRAASKLTVAFDTHNLKDNVFIYIQSIKIKDIPTENYLGRRNRPGEEGRTISDELVDGETLYLANASATDNAKADHGKWRMLARGNRVWGLNSEAGNKMSESASIEDRIKNEHLESVEALYFYENSQPEGIEGTESDKRQDVTGENKEVSYPDGEKPDNPAWKDARPYGSYVEVKGYYICEDNVRPGKGEILYRFMLGKNTTTDYDAERNHHYQLTMHFNGYANDIDFHIVYNEEYKPGTYTNDTTYVSYLYNQPATTVLRATPKAGYKLTNVKAVIVDNEWRPHSDTKVPLLEPDYNSKAWDMQISGTDSYAGGAAYNQKLDPECAPNCEFGFLSLRTVEKVTINMGGGSTSYSTMVKNFRNSYAANDAGDATKPKGMREYQVPAYNSPVESKTYPDAVDGNYTVSYTIKNQGRENEEHNYIYTIPLYTRAKTLDSWGVYSGANPFYQHHRYARIKFITTFENINNPDDKYQDSVYSHVLQARRIDNPRGIYRSGSNTDPFNVKLLYTLLVPNNGQAFREVISRGPWSATIEVDEEGLAKISTPDGQTASSVGASIYGESNTPIAFKYTPQKTVSDNGQSLGAVIKVRYHNYSCVHTLVVRQGYGPTKFEQGTLNWSTFNVYDEKNLTVNPLSIGSLFRRDTYLHDAIAESNNDTYKVGDNPGANGAFTVRNVNAQGKIYTETKKWSAITYMAKGNLGTTAFGNFTLAPTNRNYHVPSTTESRKDLSDNNDINFGFGIVYGDGAGNTLDTSDAYSFSDPDNKITRSQMGVRGVVAYSLRTGRNIFFPFGALGHGRRKSREWGLTDKMAITFSTGNGLLRYGSVDVRLGGTLGQNGRWPQSDGSVRDYRYNDYRPMAYNLPDQFGGAYWHSDNTRLAMDFNYGNYMTAELGTDDLYTQGNASDALPIRPVWNPH